MAPACPPAEALPASLGKLPQLNAALVRLDPDFAGDIRRLVEATDSFVPPLAPAPAPAALVKPLPWGTIGRVLALAALSALVGALAPLSAAIGAGATPLYLGVLALNLAWLLFAGYLAGRQSDSPFSPVAVGGGACLLVSIGYLISVPPSSSADLLGILFALLLVFALMTSLTVIGGAIGRTRRARRRAAARAHKVASATSTPPGSHLESPDAPPAYSTHPAQPTYQAQSAQSSQPTQPGLAPPVHLATPAHHVASTPAPSTGTPYSTTPAPYIAAATPPYTQTPYPVASAPVATPAGHKRHTAAIVAGAVAGALLLTLIVGGAVRWNGPPSTMRAWWDESFVGDNLDSPSAEVQNTYPLLCPDVQARIPESDLVSRLQSSWATGEGLWQNWDGSHMTYTIVDESFSEAHVRVGGYYSGVNRADGQLSTYTFDNSDQNVHTVLASGLGWCLTDDVLSAAMRNG